MQTDYIGMYSVIMVLAIFTILLASMLYSISFEGLFPKVA